MKRFSLYITLLCIAFGACVSVSFAATSIVSTVAPVVGSAIGENAGNLMFDSTTGLPSSERVSINGNTLDFVGTFWSQNAGWMTFGGLGVNGAKLTGAGNNMSMIGFAWSQNAGWISFNPRGAVSTTNFLNSDVFFDKAAGKFHGFAWSENLGWINMEGVMTDITAPDITANFKPFSANNSKTFTVNDPSPIVPVGSSYIFTVENWGSTATTSSISSTSSFSHDFRKAKPYYLKITDPFGNSSEWSVQVVADVPADTITTPIDGFTAGGSASAYVSTFAESKVADVVQVHSMNMSLLDQYGNPVKNEPGIKTVNVRVAFNNNVDKDQSFSIGGILGDAIQFPGSSFAGLTYSNGTVGIDSNTSGNYSLNISSYAPTKAGYAFTNPNNISLQKLTYEVVATGGNSWVGETGGQIDKKNKIGINNLRFAPALFIGNVTNSDNWTILQGYTTDFSANLLTATTAALTNPKVAHILDIDSNILMSYQNPSNITGGTEVCNGYMKTITTFNGAYTYSDGACNRPDSSNILISPTNLNGTMGFSWIPKIIYATPANSVVKYTSEIAYKNGGVDVKYPSYSRNNSSTTLADGTILSVADTGVGVVNQSVKILGMTNARNSIDVLQGNDTNKVGSLTRTDIKNAIHKNVEIMTRGGVPPAADYEVHTGDYTIPATWPVGKDTIIVKWGNVTINNNITNSATIKGIIVLEDDVGLGGRIYISKNVSNIAAVLYTDKSIISGSSAIYYSDILPNAQTATGQLFIEGSIISDNTIGGASMTPLKCPYGAGTCTDKEAKRYDLNYFRFYTGTGASSPGAAIWVPSAGIGYPLVIEYDNRLQTAPPPGFSMTE